MCGVFIFQIISLKFKENNFLLLMLVYMPYMIRFLCNLMLATLFKMYAYVN